MRICPSVLEAPLIICFNHFPAGEQHGKLAAHRWEADSVFPILNRFKHVGLKQGQVTRHSPTQTVPPSHWSTKNSPCSCFLSYVWHFTLKTKANKRHFTVHLYSKEVGEINWQGSIQTCLLVSCRKFLGCHGWIQGRSSTCVPKPFLLKKLPDLQPVSAGERLSAVGWLCVMPPCLWQLRRCLTGGSSAPTNTAALPQHLLCPFPGQEGNLRALSGESSELDRLINIPPCTLSFLSFERKDWHEGSIWSRWICAILRLTWMSWRREMGAAEPGEFHGCSRLLMQRKGSQGWGISGSMAQAQLETAPVPAQELERREQSRAGCWRCLCLEIPVLVHVAPGLPFLVTWSEGGQWDL